MGAEDVGGRLVELIYVEREGAGPDVRRQHRRADAVGGVNAVLVGFADGTVAGVKAGYGVLDGEDADARRKCVVEGSVEVGRGDRGFEREGGHLAESVDSGVGAPRALGQDRLSGDVVDYVSEGSLNGGEVGLDLPAMEGGSVVAEDDFPGRHGRLLDGITGGFGKSGMQCGSIL